MKHILSIAIRSGKTRTLAMRARHVLSRALVYPLRKMYPGGLIVGVELDAIRISGQRDVLVDDVTVLQPMESALTFNVFWSLGKSAFNFKGKAKS